MAEQKSRTTYAIYNFTASMGGQMLAIVLQFVTRTVFIHTLGREYLGIGGLFNNILSMLSLAEFGVGSAIIFKLYEPISKNDHRRIKALMNFYKIVYRMIGVVVAVLGVILIPFLPVLIRDYTKLEEMHINVIFIYLLYLLKSVATYLFFAYKGSLIRAHQKEYILNLVNYVLMLALTVVQVITLVLFRNYTLYLFLALFEIVLENLVGALIADRMYPYLKEPASEKIERSELIDIVKDCSALFLYRMNGVVLKATDNIVIAMFRGIGAVGLYSNYVIFYTTLNSLFAKVYNSISHGLGNLHTVHDSAREYRVFKSVNLITAIIGGTAGVGLFVVADEFVRIWVGSDWVIPQPFSLLLGLEVYTLAVRQELSKYRNSMGLFQQAKYRPVASMIINLVISVALVKQLGITGVLIGTVSADWLTLMWFDPIIIHKYGFGESGQIKGYFYRLFLYTVEIAVIGAIDWFICNRVFVGHGWFSVALHAMICGFSVPAFILALSCKSDEGKYVWDLAFRQSRKFVKK